MSNVKAEQIHKAVIPAAGLGTRFLPLSKVIPKPLLPLVDEPMISWAVKELKEAGIHDIAFVLSDSSKIIMDYFKAKNGLRDVLAAQNNNVALEALGKLERELEDIKFSFVMQSEPKGDGDAVLRAKKYVHNEPFAVLFPDDIFQCQRAAIDQLQQIFQVSQKPIIGLKRVSAEKVSSYGIVAVEKIANRLYKIKKIVEKPSLSEASLESGKSGGPEGTALAICGRYVLTPDIFHYLGIAPLNKKGELILAQAFSLMLNDGIIIYGYEIEGEWLECGQMTEWMKSNIKALLTHKTYGPPIKEWLKKEKIF